MMVVGGNLFEWGTFLRRIDNFLVDLLHRTGKSRVPPRRAHGSPLATLAKVCEYLGDMVDVVRFGDDLGHGPGLFMPPEIYRRLFKPRHAALCSYAHAHSDMHTFLHSCGSIYPLLPDLIEAGFEILNPVQTNVRDMEPGRLKREFGADMTFWGGGIETRTVLNNGSPADVSAPGPRQA